MSVHQLALVLVASTAEVELVHGELAETSSPASVLSPPPPPSPPGLEERNLIRRG